MLQIKGVRHVFAGSVVVTLVALMAVTVHIQVNYSAELREVVRVKAMTVTGVVAFFISLFVMRQMLLNQRLTEELQRLLDRDRLTDAATRDFFFARMEADPAAYGVSLMVDIDHFKQVNDTYGHFAGDRVIAAVARILRENVRAEDVVCRFGGEEFVIFLQDRDRDQGFAAAERMREVVQAQQLKIGELTVGVTVSIGGSLKERVEDVTLSIQEADAALYRAKAMGRNRTVFGPTDGVQARAPPHALAR